MGSLEDGSSNPRAFKDFRSSVDVIKIENGKPSRAVCLAMTAPSESSCFNEQKLLIFNIFGWGSSIESFCNVIL